jgi:hypothetical protein
MLMYKYYKFIDKGDWIQVLKHDPQYGNRIGYVSKEIHWTEDTGDNIFAHVTLLPENGIGDNQNIEIEYRMLSHFTGLEELLRLSLKMKHLLSE